MAAWAAKIRVGSVGWVPLDKLNCSSGLSRVKI